MGNLALCGTIGCNLDAGRNERCILSECTSAIVTNVTSVTEMSRARAYVFTVNNPTEEEVNDLQCITCRYIVYQHERGEGGTVHIQGYVVFDNAVGFATAKRRIGARAHVEVRRGSHVQAKAYCTKDETRIPGSMIYERGDEPAQGVRSDLEEVRTMLDDGASLLEIAETNFGTFLRYNRGLQLYRLLRTNQRSWKTRVIILYGEPGTGKSRMAQLLHPGAYWKPHGMWWDGYEHHSEVVIDEFYGWLPYNLILNLLDRYPLNVEVKGGTVSFVARTVILTSNREAETWYPRQEFGALERRLDLIVRFSKTCPPVVVKGTATERELECMMEMETDLPLLVQQ